MSLADLEVSEITKRSMPRCRHCNSLIPTDSEVERVHFDKWISAIICSPCKGCRILHGAILKLQPEFLTARYRSDADVGVSIQEDGRICICILRNGWTRLEVDLQIFADDAKPSSLPFNGRHREIAPVAGDDRMWEFLLTCVDTCATHHEMCSQQQDPAWYPKRLLFIKQDAGHGLSLQLFETKLGRISSRYATLSHCWGGHAPIRTTRKNAKEHRKEIQWVKLPRVFQDFVTVALKLGLYYIWIDSLCIIQDTHADWAYHARHMDRIYENALFTVAAVDSRDGSEPFLGTEAPSTRQEWQAVDVPITDTVGGPCNIKARRYAVTLHAEWLQGPLEYRAWAWQERQLSVRVINFTKNQVSWHCKTSSTCESERPMLLTRSKSVSERKPNLRREWCHAVEEYSERNLTHWTDRLPALSGYASRLHTNMNAEYLAGLWLSDFPMCLAWYRRELSDSPRGKPRMWRSLDNGVPSWSWASVAGPMYWLWRYNLCQNHFGPQGPLDDHDIAINICVELKSAECKPLSDNEFGEVRLGSYIELKGKMVDAEMESDIHGCCLVRRADLKPQLVVPDCHLIFTDGQHQVYSRRACHSLLARHQSCTNENILRRATPSDKIEHLDGVRSRGQVSCVLLFTTMAAEKTHACVLVITKLPGEKHLYQRLGIGCGDPGWNGPLYRLRKDWDVWQGWEDLEEWEKWEEFFVDGEMRTVRIV